MLYLVRGKSHNHDRVLRIHAESEQEAEQIGFRRGLFVFEVTPVSSGDPTVTLGECATEVLWRSWRRTSKSPLRCFGRRVSTAQAIAIAVLGLLTWAVDYHNLILAHGRA